MMNKIIATVVVTLAVAACATPEEIRAQIDANCTAYGHSQGTPSFATCVENEYARRQQRYQNAVNSLNASRARNCHTTSYGNQAFTNCY